MLLLSSSQKMDQFDNADLPPGVEASLPWLKDIGSSDCKQAAAHVNPESNSKGQLDESSDTVMQNFRQFKQFDSVDSFLIISMIRKLLQHLRRSSYQVSMKNWK